MAEHPVTAGRLERIVTEIAEEMAAQTNRGKVADYIPPLARVDPAHFALAVVLPDGTTISAGDCTMRFSIQSVSKVFTLALALGKMGEQMWSRVGREPSGDPFNSIVQLEYERGLPRNPFINAGAIAVTDSILSSYMPKEALGEILQFVRFVAGDEDIAIDPAVARSEQETGFRNIALANFMREFGTIDGPVEQTLGVYFHHCAIAMTARQLAMAGRFLAYDGCLYPGGPRVIAARMARQINTLMLTCGHYDRSGEFAFSVGLPGKSGVGGGILAVAPGQAAIGCWSPGLNRSGNSELGSRALERLAERTGWSVFAPR
ncbi:glutaminase [Sedimentitalea nanhaiensis]|uniref:Glutaminase n=1 Tax=Sedimentitalea nanhaiensis TaxID=999627 RepID=A0A1I7D063_9RHOB|nr:glutaminase [Sedimentitalea nanhaiensis]SFU05042.1 L-glutaminase [Sedimentitalea nanhaiensis]